VGDVRGLLGDTRGRYCLFLFIAAEIIAGSIVELKVNVSMVNREGFDTLYVPPLALHCLSPCIDRG
jgi:hypothetical protein